MENFSYDWNLSNTNPTPTYNYYQPETQWPTCYNQLNNYQWQQQFIPNSAQNFLPSQAYLPQHQPPANLIHFHFPPPPPPPFSALNEAPSEKACFQNFPPSNNVAPLSQSVSYSNSNNHPDFSYFLAANVPLLHTSQANLPDLTQPTHAFVENEYCHSSTTESIATPHSNFPFYNSTASSAPNIDASNFFQSYTSSSMLPLPTHLPHPFIQQPENQPYRNASSITSSSCSEIYDNSSTSWKPFSHFSPNYANSELNFSRFSENEQLSAEEFHAVNASEQYNENVNSAQISKKVLPAWIREGLEKMEKTKKMEKLKHESGDLTELNHDVQDPTLDETSQCNDDEDSKRISSLLSLISKPSEVDVNSYHKEVEKEEVGLRESQEAVMLDLIKKVMTQLLLECTEMLILETARIVVAEKKSESNNNIPSTAKVSVASASIAQTNAFLSLSQYAESSDSDDEQHKEVDSADSVKKSEKVSNAKANDDDIQRKGEGDKKSLHSKKVVSRRSSSRDKNVASEKPTKMCEGKDTKEGEDKRPKQNAVKCEKVAKKNVSSKPVSGERRLNDRSSNEAQNKRMKRRSSSPYTSSSHEHHPHKSSASTNQNSHTRHSSKSDRYSERKSKRHR